MKPAKTWTFSLPRFRQMAFKLYSWNSSQTSLWAQQGASSNLFFSKTLRDGWRPHGQPRTAWTSAMEEVLTALNFSLHAALRKAQERIVWQPIADMAVISWVLHQRILLLIHKAKCGYRRQTFLDEDGWHGATQIRLWPYNYNVLYITMGWDAFN